MTAQDASTETEHLGVRRTCHQVVTVTTRAPPAVSPVNRTVSTSQASPRVCFIIVIIIVKRSQEQRQTLL